MDPIEKRTPQQLAAQMPERAKKDLLEWTSDTDIAGYLGKVALHEVPAERLLNPNPDIRITDDDPLNEYFALRWMGLF
jgi:hypothetical protein